MRQDARQLVAAESLRTPRTVRRVSRSIHNPKAIEASIIAAIVAGTFLTLNIIDKDEQKAVKGNRSS